MDWKDCFKSHVQGSFCVCGQPMRDNVSYVTLLCHLSLVVHIHKIVPACCSQRLCSCLCRILHRGPEPPPRGPAEHHQTAPVGLWPRCAPLYLWRRLQLVTVGGGKHRGLLWHGCLFWPQLYRGGRVLQLGLLRNGLVLVCSGTEHQDLALASRTAAELDRTATRLCKILMKFTARFVV